MTSLMNLIFQVVFEVLVSTAWRVIVMKNWEQFFKVKLVSQLFITKNGLSDCKLGIPKRLKKKKKTARKMS